MADNSENPIEILEGPQGCIILLGNEWGKIN